MFAVLEIKEIENTLKNRLKCRFRPPAVEVEKVEIPDSFSFYRIKAEAIGTAVPWDSVAEAAGSLRTRLILPQSVKADENCGVKQYQPAVFPLHVLVNSAISTLHTMALDPTKMCVSVVDENAFIIEKIKLLVPLASTIRVVTNNVYEYEKLARELMSRYGISLIISGKIDEILFLSNVIISDRSVNIPSLFSGILFTNEKRRMMNATVLTGEGITLPQKYEALLPDGTDRMIFASALYELCAVNELETLRFDKMAVCSGGRANTLPRLTKT